MSSSGLRSRLRSRILRSRILGQFGHPSGTLGALAGVVMARRTSNQRRNAWTVQQLDLQPGDHVLEIGYGPGLAIHHAAERTPHGQVVGIDHSQVMQHQARRRNRRALASGRVQLLRGSVADQAGERMAAALHDAGFTDIETRTLPLEPVDAACALGVWPWSSRREVAQQP